MTVGASKEDEAIRHHVGGGVVHASNGGGRQGGEARPN